MKTVIYIVVGVILLIATVHLLSAVLGLVVWIAVVSIVAACAIAWIGSWLRERRRLKQTRGLSDAHAEKHAERALKKLERNVDKQ